MNEFFENPFVTRKDDFLKSPAEVRVHRKVLLEDKDISPKTQKAFDKLCEKYDDIISKNSGDIGKTMLGKNQIEIKDNHGHITKVHRKDVKKIPMTEKVCQLYEEEQLGKTRKGRRAVPANKMPELGLDIAETLEIKENKHKTNYIPLALQTVVTIIIIISVIVRLSTTQLGKLAMSLKEAAITTLRASRKVYRQNMERFHNTTTAVITIATSTLNWIDLDEMNPNNDRNNHISVNS